VSLKELPFDSGSKKSKKKKGKKDEFGFLPGI
jgi:hypothetical protein